MYQFLYMFLSLGAMEMFLIIKWALGKRYMYMYDNFVPWPVPSFSMLIEMLGEWAWGQG